MFSLAQLQIGYTIQGLVQGTTYELPSVSQGPASVYYIPTQFLWIVLVISMDGEYRCHNGLWKFN